MNLSSLSAAALAAALVAAAAVLTFLRLPDLFVWAAFIGWAGMLAADSSAATPQRALSRNGLATTQSDSRL